MYMEVWISKGRSVADWNALKDAEISVGIWGAHNMNMIFEGRGELVPVR